MKALVIIWVAALLSGVGTVGYISTELDKVAIQQRECVTQCPNVAVQDAPNVVQVTSSKPLQDDPSDELQPALGYKALNWEVQNLEVR